MPNEFPHDVFLSHGAQDKSGVRPLAERLLVAVRKHLKVWFDKWVLKPGDSIPAKIEEGPVHFGFAQPGMSANALGSGWAQLEAAILGSDFGPRTSDFGLPVPLRLDDADFSHCRYFKLRDLCDMQWKKFLRPSAEETPKLHFAC